MYEYISGKLDFSGEDYIVIDVTGVGYKLFTSQNTIKTMRNGDIVKAYTHLVVKEDDLVLYGFSTREELQMFRLLLSVSGVGPKAGVSLLSQYKANDIATAIISKDIGRLTKASGIGKKIAERIVLELKDKIDTESAISMIESTDENSDTAQVIEALVALGYNYTIAANAVMKLPDINKPIDVLIKDALKMLSRI